LAVTVPEITPRGAFAVCAQLREAHNKNPATIKNPPANTVFFVFMICLIPPWICAPVASSRSVDISSVWTIRTTRRAGLSTCCH
jgi:hypothetical protein